MKKGCWQWSFVSVSLMRYIVVLQFVNHNSDFEKTKLKLLDAANLVDKVQLSG